MPAACGPPPACVLDSQTPSNTSTQPSLPCSVADTPLRFPLWGGALRASCAAALQPAAARPSPVASPSLFLPIVYAAGVAAVPGLAGIRAASTPRAPHTPSPARSRLRGHAAGRLFTGVRAQPKQHYVVIVPSGGGAWAGRGRAGQRRSGVAGKVDGAARTRGMVQRALGSVGRSPNARAPARRHPVQQPGLKQGGVRGTKRGTTRLPPSLPPSLPRSTAPLFPVYESAEEH